MNKQQCINNNNNNNNNNNDNNTRVTVAGDPAIAPEV